MTTHQEGYDDDNSNEEWRTRLYFQTPLRKQNGDIRLLTIQPAAATVPAITSGSATDANSSTTATTTSTISCFLRLDNIIKNKPQFTAISRSRHPRSRHRQSNNSNSDGGKEEDEEENEDEDEQPTTTRTTTTTIIIINGAPAPIPRDLAAALQHLRPGSTAANVNASAGPVVVWVADLCVNAADVAERSAQAAQMAAIFAAASRTFVWLGGEFPDTDGDGNGDGDVDRGICEAVDALRCLADEQQPQGLVAGALGGGNSGGGNAGRSGSGGNGWLWNAPAAVGEHLVRGVRSVAGMAGSRTVGGGGGGDGGGGGGEAAQQADHQQQQLQQRTPLHERLDALRAPLYNILNHPYWTRAWTLPELAASSSVEIGVACNSYGNGNSSSNNQCPAIDLHRFHTAAKALDSALNNATVARWLASGGAARKTGRTSTTDILATSEPANFSRSAALRMLAEREFHSRVRGRLLEGGGGGGEGWLGSSWYRYHRPSSHQHQHQHQPPPHSPSPSASSLELEPGHDLLSLLVRYFYQANMFAFNMTDDNDDDDDDDDDGPQDALYALLNLASDGPLLGIVPDYSERSFARARAETSAALLRRSAAALVLSVGAGNVAESERSWALDWTAEHSGTPVMAHALVSASSFASPLAGAGAGAGAEPQRPFKACGPADERFYRAEVERGGTTGAPETLVVKGAVVGVVRGVGEVPLSTGASAGGGSDGDVEGTFRNRFGAYLADIGRLWDEVLAVSGKSPYAREQTKVALAKISIADAEVVGGNSESGGSAANVERRATSLSFEGYQWLAGTLPVAQQGEGVEATGEASELHRYQDYLESLDRSATDRRPFLTDSGYVGTGSSDLETGDTITVPYGSRVPIALRRYGKETREGQFRVVGPVYVFGIMDGEFMKVHRKEAVLRLS